MDDQESGELDEMAWKIPKEFDDRLYYYDRNEPLAMALSHSDFDVWVRGCYAFGVLLALELCNCVAASSKGEGVPIHVLMHLQIKSS